MHVKVALGAKGEIAEIPGKLLKWIKGVIRNTGGCWMGNLSREARVYHSCRTGLTLNLLGGRV
jgi:hypothetical protein